MSTMTPPAPPTNPEDEDDKNNAPVVDLRPAVEQKNGKQPSPAVMELERRLYAGQTVTALDAQELGGATSAMTTVEERLNRVGWGVIIEKIRNPETNRLVAHYRAEEGAPPRSKRMTKRAARKVQAQPKAAAKTEPNPLDSLETARAMLGQTVLVSGVGFDKAGKLSVILRGEKQTWNVAVVGGT